MIDSVYLSRKLEILGIARGDVLFVHSAFSAVNEDCDCVSDVTFSPDTFLDALLEAVGPEGTIIFPAFTSPLKSFSSSDSPSESGILSETFRLRTEAVRSLHPTHSAIAKGKDAVEFVGDDWVVDTTCGEGSIYDLLVKSKAKIMMLGVDLNRCTMLHTCEDAADPGYLIREFGIVPPVDRPEITTVKRFPPGHRAFIFMMEELRDKPWFVQGYIGGARTLVFPAKTMYEYCMVGLRKDPCLFLCENGSCNYCASARKRLGGAKDASDNTGYCLNPNCEVCVP